VRDFDAHAVKRNDALPLKIARELTSRRQTQPTAYRPTLHADGSIRLQLASITPTCCAGESCGKAIEAIRTRSLRRQIVDQDRVAICLHVADRRWVDTAFNLVGSCRPD
jgi:hypothetical protein